MFEKFHSFFGSCKLFLVFLFLTVASFTIFGGVLHFDHADILYPEGYYENAVLVGNIFETIRPNVINLVGNDPGRITIALQDKGSISNGFTQPLLHRTIVIYLWPPESWISFQLPLENWYTYLLVHEFTHMCHLTYQDDFAKVASVILGFPYLPQLDSQLVEGITVFDESYFSSASGRLNNPFFSTGLYYYALQNFPSFNYKEIMPSDDYRGGLLYYNFTAGFYKYLVDTYGLEKVKDFLRETSVTVEDMSKLWDLSAVQQETYSDKYEKVFGKPFDEIYTDWIFSLTKLDYKQGDLIYKSRDTYLNKIDAYKSNFTLLSQKYGPVSSYIGTTIDALTFIDSEGKEKSSVPLTALDVKYDDSGIYALCKTNILGKTVNQLWDVTRNRAIAAGYISAFGIYKGNLYLSAYDTQSMKTIVKGPDFDFQYDGFIRYMDVSENYLAFLTMDNKVIIIDKQSKNIVAMFDNPTMKGPYVKFWKDGVTFIQVEGEYTIPYYYDLKEQKFYRLAEKSLMNDFVIVDDYLYYTSYIPYGKTGGMGVYKQKVQMVPVILSTPENTKTFTWDTQQKKFTSGNELAFRISTFVKPVTWIPYYSVVTDDDSITHDMSIIFTFANPENDTFLILTPVVSINENTNGFSFNGFGQYVSFITAQDLYNLSASYFYPTNDYSFNLVTALSTFPFSYNSQLQGLMTANLRSSESYNLDTLFNIVGIASAPAIYTKNLGVGFGISTNAFSLPTYIRSLLMLSSDDFEELFSLNSAYSFTSLLIGLGTDNSFAGQFSTQLSDPSNYGYDFSTAFTLFKDQAELFDGSILFKNSGNTLGLATLEISSDQESYKVHTLYDHFFLETYLSGVKTYLKIGGLINIPGFFGLDNSGFYGTFYIGVGTSPNGLPDLISPVM